jgi:hypothetical protein
VLRRWSTPRATSDCMGAPMQSQAAASINLVASDQRRTVSKSALTVAAAPGARAENAAAPRTARNG